MTAFGFTLKRVRDMITTYNQMNRTDKYSQHTSLIWLAWLNGWVFVSELSGCGFESRCSDLLWSILSNAFWRSISIIQVKRPLPKPFKTLSFKYKRHKSVECFLLKPDWYWYKCNIGLDSQSFGQISLKSKVVTKWVCNWSSPFLKLF